MGAPDTLANRSRAAMRILTQLGRVCLAVVTIGLMFYAFQYSMPEAIHTVIDSQPPAPKLADPPGSTTLAIAIWD
jgi:hypothetical protein